jgi:hypothetical protein
MTALGMHSRVYTASCMLQLCTKHLQAPCQGAEARRKGQLIKVAVLCMRLCCVCYRQREQASAESYYRSLADRMPGGRADEVGRAGTSVALSSFR